MISSSLINIDNIIGNQIRTLRRKFKLSQAILGSKIGVSFQQIQKYEKGQNKISASRLYELAIKLNTPISYFFNQPESNNNYTNNSNNLEEDASEFKYEIDIAEENLVEAFKQIKNKRNKTKLLSFLKAVAEE